MTKHFCDRCGAEVDRKRDGYEVIIESTNFSQPYRDISLVCKDCKKAIDAFVQVIHSDTAVDI